MAVNKNFVVKNGLEVNTDLIVADVDSSKVGVGTTISSYLLHVYQGTGIGASSVYVTGISTVAQEFNVGLGGSIFTVLGNAEGTAGIGQSVGVGTGEPAYLLDVRAPVSTGQTALYVQGDMRVTGDINLDDLRLDQLQVSGISTFIGLSTFASGINVLGLGATTTTLEVTGVSTLGGTVDINNSVEVSGITTIQNTTQSSASTNGALNVDGGVGIEKNLFVGGGSEITGILTVTNSVDFNSDLDVDGHTELDDTQISGIATVTNTTDSDSKDTGALVVEGGVGIEKNLNVGAGLSVVGFSTFADTVQIQSLTDNRVAIVGAGSTIEDDGNLTFDGGQLEVGVGLSVAGLSTFVGVGTFISDLYVGGDLFISENITLDTNLNILGIATVGTLDVTNYSTLGLGLEVSGAGSTTTTLTVSGVSTFTGSIDANGDVDIDGHTELDDVNVSGASTFTGAADFNGDIDVDGHTELDNLNVAGFSTFVGFSTFNDYVFIQDGLNVTGPSTSNSYTINGTQVISSGRELQNIASLDATTTSTIESAIANAPNTFTDLRVSGVSTFIGLSTFAGGAEFQGVGATLTTLTVSGVSSVSGVSTAALFGGYAALSAPSGSITKTFTVTVSGKTQDHRYSGGSINGYYLDEIESPFLTLTPGRTYRFDQADSSNAGHPLRFYLEADKTTAYTTDVTTNGTPGSSGAYTEIIVTDTTPTVLHYQCSSHDYMGSAVQTNSNTIVVSAASTFSGAVDINAALDVDGHTELDDVNVSGASTFTGAADFNGAVDIDGHLEVDDVNVSGASTFTGAADFNGAVDIDGHLEVDDVNIAGFSTFASNVDINAQVDISTDILVGGASTFTGAADFNGAVDIDGHTELDDVNVSGASTFTGAADFNGAVDIDGHTELDDVNVSGASTFTGAADFNGDIDVDGHTELDNLNVAGFSTFVGFATFSDYVFVQDGLNVTGIITATSFDGLGQIGVGSEGTFIGAGITMVDFKSSNTSNTVDVDGTSGIATVTVTTGVSIGLAIALGG